MTKSEPRQLIETAYAHGIAEVLPGNAVRHVLQRTDSGFAVGETPVPVSGRLIVVAIGKAATPMAVTATEVLGDVIDQGVLITKDGHATGEPALFDVYEASHPVPDERGVRASRAVLETVEGLGAGDVVLALVSGGGSALFEVPAGDLTLMDIQRVTDLLLRAGAPIQDLNAVRPELSEVKGGGFRRQIGPARVVSLILSDVLGNPPGVIASGPTIVREPDPAEALSLLERYKVTGQVPHAVLAHLQAASAAEPRQFLPENDRDIYRIVGDNAQFVQAVGDAFEQHGLTVRQIWHDREGEAREQAVAWVEALEQADAGVVLGGGELTVTVRGDGVGGRNTEFALAAAIALRQHSIAATVASLASDGQDGGVDAAGAIVDATSEEAIQQAGIEPAGALARNDSGTALDAIGALLMPGPTGTNVNDVYIGMRPLLSFRPDDVEDL